MTDDFTERITPGAFSSQLGKVVPFTNVKHERIGATSLNADGTADITITDPDWANRLGFTRAQYVFPYGFVLPTPAAPMED